MRTARLLATFQRRLSKRRLIAIALIAIIVVLAGVTIRVGGERWVILASFSVQIVILGLLVRYSQPQAQITASAKRAAENSHRASTRARQISEGIGDVRDRIDRSHSSTLAAVESIRLHALDRTAGSFKAPIGGKGVRCTRPSFAYSIAAANRRKDYPPVAALSKTACRNMLLACDAPVPENHETIGSIDALIPQHLEEPRVIKPVRGSTSHGVCALYPSGRESWIDLLTGVQFSFEDLVGHLKNTMSHRRLKDEWMLEELLMPADGTVEPVHDVKVYTFRGRIPLILLRGNRPKRFRWFTPDWEPLDIGKYEDLVGTDLQPPSNGVEVLDIARRISVQLPIPFMRVDCYDTSRGIVVGELTPLPGASEGFNDEWDEILGAMYEEEEKRLLVEGVDWHRVTERDQVLDTMRERIARVTQDIRPS